MRLLSYQAVAHGADTVMFFQMRRSIGACEKFHSAVIDHVGHEHTRQFREIAELGMELENHICDLTLGGRTESKIAIVFDWDNWWAAEFSAGPSKMLSYAKEVKQYYKALFMEHYAVDMISVEDVLDDYQLVIAPLLYMCKEGFDEKIRAFVKAGGTFLTTYFSGYVDEHDLVVCGGYPGKLRDILGIWVEELDALAPEERNSFVYNGMTYSAQLACDLLHLEGAESLAEYQSDFYQGMPVVTKHAYGEGLAYYVATHSEEGFYRTFLKNICDRLAIRPVAQAPDGVEATLRKNEKGEFLFLLNHTEESVMIPMETDGQELLSGSAYKTGESLLLPKAGVAIIQR